ncbi:reverse transcriptase domain-containing protein [Tanacetum coccineum]
MRTRSQARISVPEPPVRQPSVESSNLEKPDNPPIVTMADNRTMAQLLEAPTEGYEDAIVIPEITANNFEIKHGLLNLVQNKQFFGNDKEDPHAHIRYFNKITSTMKIPNQKFDETFYEAWDRFNDLLRGCPHHGFSELHQLDTFYNALNSNDQDSLNSAAGGNFLDKMPRECLKIIESKSKDPHEIIKTIFNRGNNFNQSMRETILNLRSDYRPPVNQPVAHQPVAHQGPAPQTHGVSKRLKDMSQPMMQSIEKHAQKQGQNMQFQMANLTDLLLSKFVTANTAPLLLPNVAPVVTPVPQASIPFPSRRNDERRKEKANDQNEKFYEIFRDLSFEISFTRCLVCSCLICFDFQNLTVKQEEKIERIGKNPLNEELFSAELLHSNALADLELADRSITKPIGIAEDVFVNVGKFQFPADFVVVDFEPDPRVPLILGRCFLKTSHALIDVYEGEITLRVGKEAITFNLDQTSRYTADYNHMTVNKIDVIELACDEYSQEVLGFSDMIASGNPTPCFDPIVSTASPTLTPFGDSDFLLFEEADSFLALEDDPTSSEVDPTYQDPEGDILLLEAILNTKTVESSVDEPPEVELKELPPHLEYAFLEGDDKLPVIIAKDLKDEEKAALLKVLKSHKRAICAKSEKGKPKNPRRYQEGG